MNKIKAPYYTDAWKNEEMKKRKENAEQINYGFFKKRCRKLSS